MDVNRQIWKLSSLFLAYPDKEWYQQEEVGQFIAELPDGSPKTNLQLFWDYVLSTTWLEYGENYVKQFDFSKDCSLYLTYDVFGEQRERGLGFVKLKLEFAKAGFYISNDELPDYLPLVLEFFTEAEDEFVHKLYYIHKKPMDTLYDKLRDQQSPYAYVVAALLETLDQFVAVREKMEEKTV
ncbi:nitrate reductase molybdenum cofactor assembly chaperone [Alteribacillus iranensis]|uniref:Respiratory nitrate reductase chaperone NarJ n=1 Tax=Alteribacillus iranensis TaxID=930128 RepID=A0A1I2E5E1_9BACI|nr:nitrate reductase molybdenum cofactor assembly chaperone [Alteribacillus iranensis]SFE88162.1 respiratory nitrate reductase chaperone NarJ [Alteribacillus iranensis]